MLCFSPHPEQSAGLGTFVARAVDWAAARPRQSELSPPQGLWKVGVARSNITPTNALWLGGYAGRTHPAEGKATDLWLKALALEDASGHRAVIVTADLLAIRGSLYRSCLPRLKEKFGLDPSQILLTASHTHCGPMLVNRPGSLSALDETQRTLIEAYCAGLGDKIIETTGRALADLAPARLAAGQAEAGFGANRRNNADVSAHAWPRQGTARRPGGSFRPGAGGVSAGWQTAGRAVWLRLPQHDVDRLPTNGAAITQALPRRRWRRATPTPPPCSSSAAPATRTRCSAAGSNWPSNTATPWPQPSRKPCSLRQPPSHPR